MTDFLLELLSEEIPARMQGAAREHLVILFAEEMKKAGISSFQFETYATPRRLALIARGLPLETEAVRDEIKGPRASAPPQALEGFLRKTGLARESLVERDGIFYAVTDKPGRSTASVLAEAIPTIVRAFPWPKSMRWGEASQSTESMRWVRPLQGIVALLGEDIVEFEIAGVRSGAATVGHRFRHPGIITIGSANDYAEKLRACHVVIDPAERRRIIAEGAAAAAAADGLSLIEDEGLLHENAGLTEWPVPLLGSFDPAFLAVPREVIQLTMRTNQKYFALVDGEGKLAPNFVCTANIDAADGGASIIAGNERVLSARLSDAKFFWEQDLKVPLEEQAAKLGQIVFHEKLGTVADKVERVAKLARWLVEEGIIKPSPPAGEGQPERSDGRERGHEQLATPLPNPSPAGGEGPDLAQLAETAARLCKADLVTGMVGEFPELQGIIGGYLARAQGHPDAVADAIRDHYKPVGQGDEVPTAPVTVAVSLADKLDTLLGFFSRAERPSGSKDPFALRRTAIGILHLLTTNELRLDLYQFTDWVGLYFFYDDDSQALGIDDVWYELSQRDPNYQVAFVADKIEYRAGSQVIFERTQPKGDEDKSDIVWQGYEDFREFLVDRLKVQQRSAGIRHDLIEAVFALSFGILSEAENDLVRLLARVRALQSFVETPEGADLLAGYKRAANILKKEGWTSPLPENPPLPAREGPGVGGEPSEPSLSGAEPPSAPSTADPSLQGRGENSLSYTPENEESALIAALDSAEPRARAAIEAEDFGGAMAALASLRGPVDSFFDKVTVNDPDAAKRTARLDLLLRMRQAVHQVADFSKIEG